MSNSATKILLAEDDASLGTILSEYLKLKECEVKWVKDGIEAESSFIPGNFDILILDVMMPKMDGFKLLEAIRQQDKQVPVIFLTAKSMLEDKKKGFLAGADDYLTKPFSMEELMLRIRALLKRNRQVPEPEKDFNIGRFQFHYPQRKLVLGDQEKKITSREAELLLLLCQHSNDILRREVALKKIWGDDSYFNGRSMDVFITKLRKLLKEDPTIEIQNVHGTGFRLLVHEANNG